MTVPWLGLAWLGLALPIANREPIDIRDIDGHTPSLYTQRRPAGGGMAGRCENSEAKEDKGGRRMCTRGMLEPEGASSMRLKSTSAGM